MALVLDTLPAQAAWQHHDVRDGFEVLAVRTRGTSTVLGGHTTGLEDGQGFAVGYSIGVDDRWRTRRASLRAWWPDASGAVEIEGDGAGSWTVQGEARPDLDGCLDVDLESSACTNALPLRRLGLAVGEVAEAPAVYVRAFDLAVERLDQTYERRSDDADGHVIFHYTCPRFDADLDLTYDRCGLIVDYPTLATRVN